MFGLDGENLPIGSLGFGKATRAVVLKPDFQSLCEIERLHQKMVGGMLQRGHGKAIAARARPHQAIGKRGGSTPSELPGRQK